MSVHYWRLIQTTSTQSSEGRVLMLRRLQAIIWTGEQKRLASVEANLESSAVAVPPETMRGLHHFQTLIAAKDRLYVAADGAIYAFAF